MGRTVFDPRFDHLGTQQMTVNGLHCTFNMPHALEARYDGEGNEVDQGLPPYGQRVAFNVDEFDKACPDSWMRGGPQAASHFVPVKPEHGLWLDFNANASHTHYVAVRISIQGVCAVTGLPTKDRFHLEQYRTRCPKHDIEFGAERFCQKCNFKWPDQNYLATTGTHGGMFWLDGFRAKDGCTRQFVFTEEEMRGVAAQIIGADRVFAIGVAFYLSKEPKPRPIAQPALRRYAAVHHLSGGDALHPFGGGYKNGLPSYSKEAPSLGGVGATDTPWGAVEPAGGAMGLSDDILFVEEHLDAPALGVEGSSLLIEEMCEEVEMPIESSSPDASRDENPVPLTLSAPRPRPQHLEIAAGARINQPIFRDPSELSFWQDEPAGIIYINYCDEATARATLSQGKEDRTAHGEGFMADLRVGNPAPSA